MFRMLGKALLTVVIVGFLVMLLSAFNGDIFAIIEWAASMFWYAVNQVASWLDSTSLPDWLSIR